MPKPSFSAEYEADWSTFTSPKSVTATWQANDVLVVFAISADSLATIDTPTSTGVTFTLRQSVVVTLKTAAYIWTARPTSGATQSISVATGSNLNSVPWGFNVFVFGGTDGVGASASTNGDEGAPSLAISPTGANSALVVANGDWDGTDGVTRTWRTVNGITPTAANGLEKSYYRDGAQYTIYGAYYDDAGAAGAKTVGLSAPAGQDYSILAVEVFGSATAAASSPARPRQSNIAVMRAATN